VLACLASTPFSRFQTLLYLDRGLTPSQLGTLQLTLPLKAMGYFVWGVLGDRIGMQKALILCILMSTLAMEPLRWSATFTDFRYVFVAKAIRTSMNAAWPLVDGFAVKAVGLSMYGSVRLWGSLSFGVSGLVIGFILDYFYATFGFQSIFVLSYVLAAVVIAMLFMCFPKDSTQLSAAQSGHDIVRLLSNRTLFLFLVCAMLFGASFSISSQVVPVWVRKDLGKGAAFLGMLSVCSIAVGLGVLHYAGYLLERFGAKRLLLVAHVGHGVRIMLYMLVNAGNCNWLLPAVETLNCFSFALFWSSATSMLHSLCSEQIMASSQSLLAIAHTTMGTLVGTYVLMNVYEAYGFYSVCNVALAGTVFSGLFSWGVLSASRPSTLAL
jgi:PPP family 3-phenylpropionic acid transporter